MDLTGRVPGMGLYRTQLPRCASPSTSTPPCTTTGTCSKRSRSAASASQIPYAEQVVWEIDRLKPEQLRAAVKRDALRAADPRLRALPGRGRDRPPAGTRPATSSTSRRTAPGDAHGATAQWLERIGLPYDELYCSDDKVSRCEEIGIDLLIDDSPENLRAGDRRRDHGRDDRAPLEPRAVRDGGRGRAARTGPSSPGSSSRCWRREAAAGPQHRSARLPAGHRAGAPGLRLGPLGARRGRCSTRRSTSSSTTTGSAARSRGSRTSRPTAARCSSPTTRARSRPTRR